MPFSRPKQMTAYMAAYMRERRRRLREGLPTRTTTNDAVDWNQVRNYVEAWCEQLRLLCEGRPGEMYIAIRGKNSNYTHNEEFRFIGWKTDKAEAILALPSTKACKHQGECNCPVRIDLPGKSYMIVRPIPAQDKTWQQLCGSVTNHISAALLRIKQAPHAGEENKWEAMINAAQEQVAELRKAKKLPRHPRRKNGPSVNKKRIEFYGKVLAALAVHRKPDYILQKLASWHPSTVSLVKKSGLVQPPVTTVPTDTECPNCRGNGQISVRLEPGLKPPPQVCAKCKGRGRLQPTA